MVFCILRLVVGCFFAQVVRQGQQACFHLYFLQSPKHKAAEVMVLFQVAKHRLHITGPLLSVPDAFFTQEPLVSLSAEAIEVMIDFNDPVSFALVTDASYRTTLTIDSLVQIGSLLKAGGGFLLPGADTSHLLSHRTIVAVLLLIVKQLLRGKRKIGRAHV